MVDIETERHRRTSSDAGGALGRPHERPCAPPRAHAVIQVCVAWLIPPAAEKPVEVSRLTSAEIRLSSLGSSLAEQPSEVVGALGLPAVISRAGLPIAERPPAFSGN